MNTNANLPYLIVEIANSHGGQEKIVDDLIDKFKSIEYTKKGIKFQIFSPEKISLPDFEWFPVYKELFFNESTWSKFIENSCEHGDVWVDIFDLYGAGILLKNLGKICGIKLQASVLENMEVRAVLKKINLTEKKIILNLSGIEIDCARKILNDFENISRNIILQIGYQSYPTKIENTGLSKIPILQAAFPGVPICMADHSDATDNFALYVPVYASLLGCQYIEKHFCCNRKSAKYDGYSALEYTELNNVCSALKDAFSALTKEFISDAERDYLAKSIQIPVLKRDIAHGELIGVGDLIYRRTSKDGIDLKKIIDIQKAGRVIKVPKNTHDTIMAEDYRAAKVAAIVAGRMKSTRLPQKAILPIMGVSSVERCLAQCIGIRGVEQVVLATSTMETDNILKNYTLGGAAFFWQGDPDDVISRYLGACEHYGIDIVVRITADCPLVLPEIIEYLLKSHFESGADYTAAEDCAVGSSGEIVNVSALKKIINHFGSADHSEYMTWYFMNNPEYFKINIVSLPEEWVRDYRMTLDYPEDLKMFEMLYSLLDDRNKFYSARDVFHALDSSPEVASINRHIKLKYKTDQNLIDLLNKKTKMYQI